AQQARSTLRDFQRLRANLDDLQQLRRGAVRLSSMELGVPGVMLSAVRTFTYEHPNITFEIVVAGSELQIIALAQQEFDLGLVFDPPPHPDVVVECAVSYPICAIVHPEHELANYQTLVLVDL
ncbi:MAG TPA: substrate-binding domain-containing protein, partial [Sphingobium sp.]